MGLFSNSFGVDQSLPINEFTQAMGDSFASQLMAFYSKKENVRHCLNMVIDADGQESLLGAAVRVFHYESRLTLEQENMSMRAYIKLEERALKFCKELTDIQLLKGFVWTLLKKDPTRFDGDEILGEIARDVKKLKSENKSVFA